MSTDAPAPPPPVAAVPARPVLAGWALGLALAGPGLLLISVPVSGLAPGETSAMLAGVGLLLAPPSVLTGLALGLGALAQARRGGGGRGLALAAVALAAAQIVTVVLLFVSLFVIFALGGFE